MCFQLLESKLPGCHSAYVIQKRANDNNTKQKRTSSVRKLPQASEEILLLNTYVTRVTESFSLFSQQPEMPNILQQK